MSTQSHDPPHSVEAHVLAKGMGLLLLLTLANFWADYHFGWGLESSGLLAGAAAAFASAFAVLERILGKQQAEAVSTRFRTLVQALLRLVSFRAQGLLWLVFVFLVIAYSSVRILPPESGLNGEVVLTPVDVNEDRSVEELRRNVQTQKVEPGEELLRFGVLSSLFGLPYELKVPGYLAADITVYPLVGARIDVGRDLTPSPRLLLRPTPEDFSYLIHAMEVEGVMRQGRLELYVDAGGKLEKLLAVPGLDSSLLVGRDFSPPPGLMKDWELELRALGLDPLADGTEYARELLRWRRYESVVTSKELKPGMKLVVKIFSAADKNVTTARFELGSGAFSDHLIYE